MELDRLGKWDVRMLDLAVLVSTWSKDPGTKVGAVIADGNRVISTGYNGFPSKLQDVDLEDRDWKLSRTIHAELNAIFNARQPVTGMTLYSTFACCDRCAAHIIQAGIARVVWMTTETVAVWKISQRKGEEYFYEAGVQCYQYHR